MYMHMHNVYSLLIRDTFKCLIYILNLYIYVQLLSNDVLCYKLYTN